MDSGGLRGPCNPFLHQRCFPTGEGELGCWDSSHCRCMGWGSRAGCQPPALHPAHTAGCTPICTAVFPDEPVPLPSPLPWGGLATWLHARAAGGQIRGDRRETNSLKRDRGNCLVLSAIAPPPHPACLLLFFSLSGYKMSEGLGPNLPWVLRLAPCSSLVVTLEDLSPPNRVSAAKATAMEIAPSKCQAWADTKLHCHRS